MKLFAVDSSGSAASAAVFVDGKILTESFSDVGLTHSTTLLYICDEAMKRASLKPSDFDAFAVSDGPGSFTGLRIGISLVKGFAYPFGTPCIPVSTMEALSANVPPSDGTVVLTCSDARRNRVYYAAFSGGKRLCPDGIMEIPSLPSFLRNLGDRFIAVGDCAEKVVSQIGGEVDISAAPEHLSMCRASSVAKIAAEYYDIGEFVTPAELKPSYLQPSQAEREKNSHSEERQDK
ncbi:MAG: tRNA (adenosine(37)-N6)-threonylcarbamoyltransferase complex dimerization subunit type 1 TsaB [Oscillospiraceae bacterium]|jgi:tRNA threonylcarbamoyladenosine biosynthesis protein TsaB